MLDDIEIVKTKVIKMYLTKFLSKICFASKKGRGNKINGNFIEISLVQFENS